MRPPTAPQRNTKRASPSVPRTCPTAPIAARVRMRPSQSAPSHADTFPHSHPNQAQPDRKGETEEGIRKAKATSRRRPSTQTPIIIRNRRRRQSRLARRRHTGRSSREGNQSTATIKTQACTQAKVTLSITSPSPCSCRRDARRRTYRLKSLGHPSQPPPKNHPLRKRTPLRPTSKARSRRTPCRIRDLATRKS
jgi:hypothetical protein